MSNTSKTVAPSQVESGAATSEAPTKVVQMDNGNRTVDQVINMTAGLVKATRDLNTLYAMREKFNSLFFGTGDKDPKELKGVFLVPHSENRYGDDDSFKISNPETMLQIRALVGVGLSDRIEELENQIVAFKI